jgi:hypothetical protein
MIFDFLCKLKGLERHARNCKDATGLKLIGYYEQFNYQVKLLPVKENSNYLMVDAGSHQMESLAGFKKHGLNLQSRQKLKWAISR